MWSKNRKGEAQALQRKINRLIFSWITSTLYGWVTGPLVSSSLSLPPRTLTPEVLSLWLTPLPMLPPPSTPPPISCSPLPVSPIRAVGLSSPGFLPPDAHSWGGHAFFWPSKKGYVDSPGTLFICRCNVRYSCLSALFPPELWAPWKEGRSRSWETASHW